MVAVMEVDADEHQMMEVDEQPELILGINQQECMSNNICTIKSLNNVAKIFKFDNYEEFIVFKNKEEVNANTYPDLFVFTVYLSDLSDDFFDPIKEEILKKFYDNRPLVIEFKKIPSEAKVFVKNFEHFELVTELNQYQLNRYLSQNIFDFTTLLAALKYSSNLRLPQVIFDLVCKSENILLAKFLNIFPVDGDKKAKMINEHIESSNDLAFLCALLDFPFDFVSRHKVSENSQKFMAIWGLEILKKAVEFKKRVFVDFLLNCFKSCFDSCDFDKKQEISQIAHGTDKNGNFSYLIKADFPFPEQTFSYLHRNIFDNRRGLHDAIVDNDIKKVEEFVEKYQFTRIAYDISNQSALMKALENKKFEIYVLLKSRGYKACDQKKHDDIIDGFFYEKDIIAQFGIKYSADDPKKFALVIASKAHLHNQLSYLNEDDEKFKKIRKLLFELNEISLVKLVFKITADYLSSVNFDFTSKYTYGMAPVNKNSIGYCDSRDATIYIGAEYPDDRVIKDTIVHEFTHLAMQVIYENDALPHFAHRDDLKTEMDNVIKESREKKLNISENVSSVFKKYENTEWSPELIVVMFVMVAELHKDPPSLDAFQQTYKELSTFYEKVKKDLENFDPQKRKEIRSLNKDFGVIKKIKYNLRFHSASVDDTTNQVFITKVPSLTLASIYQQMSELYEKLVDVNCLFVDFNELLTHSDIFERYRKFVESNDVRIIVDLTQEIKPVVIQKGIISKVHVFQQIFTRKDLKFILLVSETDIYDYLDGQKISLKKESPTQVWDDLTSESKNNILMKFIHFHDKPLQLSKIIPSHLADKIFDESFLGYILGDEMLSINSLKDNPQKSSLFVDDIFHDIYIDRKLFRKIKKVYEAEVSEEEYNLQELLMLNKRDHELTLISRDKVKKTCKIRRTNVAKHYFSEKDIVNNSKHLPYVLISDFAGSGKSKFLKKSLDHLKSLYTEEKNICYIYRVDLQEFFNDFISAGESIIFEEFFTNKILKGQKDCEKSFFNYSYKFSKVIILFDGFDEISPKCTKNVVSFIKSFVRQNESQLWITTRVHLEVYLEKELQLNEFFSICAFTPEDQLEYLVKCWNKFKLPGNLTEIARELVEKLSTVMTHSSNLIGIPQQLQVIADAYFENNKFALSFLENLSKYSLYQKSIAKKIKNWRTRDPISIEASIRAEQNDTSFYSIHKFLSMKKYFESCSSFCALTRNAIWTDEQVIRCGVVKQFENNSPIFIHETFKDFFAAVYVIQGLNRPIDWKYFDEFFEHFVRFIDDERLEIARIFINDALKKEIIIPEENLVKFANILAQKDSSLIMFPALEECKNLLDFILSILRSMRYDFVKYVLNQDLIYKSKKYKLLVLLVKHKKLISIRSLLNFSHGFLKTADFEDLVLTSLNGLGLLHLCPSATTEFLKQFLRILQEKCSLECFKKILLCPDNLGRPPLHYFAMTSIENLKIFWEYLEQAFEGEKKLIEFKKIVNKCANDKDKMTVFHAAIIHENTETFEFLMERIRPNVDIFLLKNLRFKGKNALQMLVRANFYSNILSFENQETLNMESSKRTIEISALEKSFEFHKKLWENLRKSYTSQDIKDMIEQPDDLDNTFIHILGSFSHKRIMELTLQQIKEIFNNEREFKTLLRSKGFNKRMLLQKAADRVDRNVDDQKFLWKYVKELFGDDFNEFYEHTDDGCDNIFHTIVSFSSAEVLNEFIEFLESFLLFDQIKPLLETCGYNERNLLQNAAINNTSLELQKSLWNILKKYFQPNEIINFIDYTERFDSNLLHVAVAFAPLNICKFTWQMIQSVHDKEMQKNYLLRNGFKSQSLIRNCESKNRRYRDVADWLRDLFEEYNIHF